MEKSFLNGVTSEKLQQVYNLIKDSDWVTSLQFSINEQADNESGYYDSLLIHFTNIDGKLMSAEISENTTELYLVEFVKDATATHNKEVWSLYDNGYDTTDFVKYILSFPRNLSSIKKV